MFASPSETSGPWRGGPVPDDPGEALSEAVFVLLAGAGGADLLRFMTDRDVAVAAGLSAARVRRAFTRRPGTEQLDRAHMLNVAVERALDVTDAQHAACAARWRWASGKPRDRSGQRVASTLVDVCSCVEPSAEAKVASLAAALAGDDPELRELLRYAGRRRDAHYRAAVAEMLGELSGARPNEADVDMLGLVAATVATRITEHAHVHVEADSSAMRAALARLWDAVVGDVWMS